MTTPFTIRITKKIIDCAKFCGQREHQNIGENCAIAVALKDLFPAAFVSGNYIYPFGIEQAGMTIELPRIALDFIKVFDSLIAIPKVRLLLPEFDFVIGIPDNVLEQINIDEIKKMGITKKKTGQALLFC
jgi:hypothetical protein